MIDELDDVFPINEPAPEPEAVVEASPEPEVVTEPVEPEPQSQPEPPVEPEAVAPGKPEPGYVPLAVVLDTRDKLREAEARLAQYEQQQAQQPQAPDPYDDPQGYARFIEEKVEQRETALRFQFSDRFARQAHGEEAVEAATQWAQGRAQSDPVFAASYMRESDPIGWIVQQHKRDGLISQIGDRSIDDFVRDYVTRNPNLIAGSAPAAAAPVAAAPQPASPPVRVPRSLATQGSAPSDVRDVATGPLAGVDALFS